MKILKIRLLVTGIMDNGHTACRRLKDAMCRAREINFFHIFSTADPVPGPGF